MTRRWAGALLLFALASLPLAAQVASSVQGRVTDETGFGLPGVTVTLSGGDAPRLGVTDAEGRFRFVGVRPGTYLLLAELEGFSVAERAVRVTLGAAASADLVLEMAYEEDILVTAERPLLDERDETPPAWNTWLEFKGAAAGEPIERLEPGRLYHVTVDLSRFRYQDLFARGARSTTPARGFLAELERAFYQDRRVEIVAHLRPVLAGRAIALPDDALEAESWEHGGWRRHGGGDPMVPMPIRLGNLFDPHAEGRRPDESFRAFAERTRAGGVRFAVEALREGCAAVTLAVWSEDRRLPVDELVHPVTVGDAECPQPLPASDVRPGWLSSLYTVSEPSPDAALQLYEVPVGRRGRVRTVAVFTPDRPVAGCTQFVWERPASMARFFFEDRGFRQGLRTAWSDKRNDRYPDLARQLRRLLFPRRDDESCGGAAALAALESLARSSNRSLYARLIDIDNRALYMPLGLLFAPLDSSAEGGADGFRHAISLRQPLPRQSFSPSRGCVGEWSFVLPAKLHGYDSRVELPPRLDNAEGTLRELDELRDLLSPYGSFHGEPASGIVILAHHVDGSLSFDDPADPWLWTELEAEFPPGSVALLSVCSAGDLSRSRALVEALNDANFDAIILSPFEVYTPFGVELALRFSERIAEHLEREDAPRVVDVYRRALADTVQALEPELGSRARGMARELVFAGDETLRLCGAEGE